ncbi:hypothetical protein [Deinococcus peraridilitoris]|uniref:hypothetical protein n=1 Tax=Deinococcus peraridilitoris TaxID=432329 RepID=UPI0002F6ED6C|nr:hypothetical protein [Deinococcus peraridilitoris]
MTAHDAALLDPTSLAELLKRHSPFLRIYTLRRVADVGCALILAQSTRSGRALLQSHQ